MPATVVIQVELEQLTGIRRNRLEQEQEYLIRIIEALDDVPSKKYESLSKDAKDWACEAAKAYNGGLTIPSLSSPPEDGKTEEEEVVPEEKTEVKEVKRPRRQAAAALPAKSETKATKARDRDTGLEREGKGGGLVYVRKVLCQNPDISVVDLAEKVKAKGFSVSVQTLHTTRSGFRQDLRTLQEAGLLRKKMI